jgi:hypothetical protein
MALWPVEMSLLGMERTLYRQSNGYSDRKDAYRATHTLAKRCTWAAEADGFAHDRCRAAARMVTGTLRRPRRCRRRDAVAFVEQGSKDL